MVILIIQQYEFYFDKIYDTFSSPFNLKVRVFLKKISYSVEKNLQSLYFPTRVAFHSKFGCHKERQGIMRQGNRDMQAPL